MSPTERWNDQALDQLAETVRALGPSVGQVITASVELKGLAEKLAGYKEWTSEIERHLQNQIAAVAQSCSTIHVTQGEVQLALGEIRADLAAQAEKLDNLRRGDLSRGQRTIAWIGASAVVIAALLGAAAAFLNAAG